jgi:hypothetical protein
MEPQKAVGDGCLETSERDALVKTSTPQIIMRLLGRSIRNQAVSTLDMRSRFLWAITRPGWADVRFVNIDLRLRVALK